MRANVQNERDKHDLHGNNRLELCNHHQYFDRAGWGSGNCVHCIPLLSAADPLQDHKMDQESLMNKGIFKIEVERRKIVSVLELMNILRTMDGETEIRLLPHPEDGISCAAMLAEVMEVTHMHGGERVENYIVFVPAE